MSGNNMVHSTRPTNFINSTTSTSSLSSHKNATAAPPSVLVQSNLFDEDDEMLASIDLDQLLQNHHNLPSSRLDIRPSGSVAPIGIRDTCSFQFDVFQCP